MDDQLKATYAKCAVAHQSLKKKKHGVQPPPLSQTNAKGYFSRSNRDESTAFDGQVPYIIFVSWGGWASLDRVCEPCETENIVWCARSNTGQVITTSRYS